MKKHSKYRYSGISFLIISFFTQIIAIPIIHFILYSIALIFHTPFICEICGGMDLYPLVLIYIFTVNTIITFLLTLLQEILENEFLISGLHLTWYLFVVWFSFGDLKYRPYEHGLLLFCLGLQIPLRILIRKGLHIKK